MQLLFSYLSQNNSIPNQSLTLMHHFDELFYPFYHHNKRRRAILGQQEITDIQAKKRCPYPTNGLEYLSQSVNNSPHYYSQQLLTNNLQTNTNLVNTNYNVNLYSGHCEDCLTRNCMTLDVTTSNLSESSLPLGSFSTQYTTSDQQSVENSLKLSRQHEKPVENFSDFSANSSINHSHNQPQTQEFSALPFMTQSIISTTMKPLQNVAALQQTEVPHPVGYIHSPTVPALSPVLPIPSRTENNNLASNSPVKTKQYETTGLPIILDGRSYEPEELISLIQRLRQDIRGYTDHIRWLEQELSQTRIALNARDRDIDKLKSVLDQKLHNKVSLLPTYPVTPLSDTSRQLIMHNKLNVTRVSPTSRVAGLSESVLQSPEKLRTKKQGVSGESFTEQRLSGLVHHDKDIWFYHNPDFILVDNAVV
ncbi:cGMP-dependent protein kinase 1 [Schistosoma japonicum]|nr:cGMP-dependent protein kinase 1 [Schistosoma japonicum]